MRMSHFHVKRSRIRHIFISHLHGDHYFGLIGLLTSYHLMGRTDPLTVYAPAPLEEIIRKQLAASNTTLRYDLGFVATNDERRELLVETNAVSVWSFPLKHRIPTTGFLFKEKITGRRIIKEKIEGLDLDPQQFRDLKDGKDLVTKAGETIANESLTKAPHDNRTYAYCSDTVYFPELKEYIGGVHLLYHEATFLQEDAVKARDTFHSTTEDAAKLAVLVDARHLLIGHFSSKYTDLNVYKTECVGIFPKTLIALEGSIYSVNRDGSLHVS